MKAALILICTATLLALVGGGQIRSAETSVPKPAYKGNKLVRPEGYREWVYLSSGLGMNYSPDAGAPEMFTNVFVPQWSYRIFLSTGKWPDKTMFVVEDRMSESKGSIVKSGHFQSDLKGLGVEVKDEQKFPEKWAYFAFGSDSHPQEAMPKEHCWNCHENNAAVEHVFVQFYPTLKPAAQKFGTYRAERERVDPQH
jgi:Cytochrome P460